jgi:hypothetical protein
MVKQRWHDSETTMVRWRDGDSTIHASLLYIARKRYRHVAGARTSSPDTSALVVQWTENTLGSCASGDWRPQTMVGSLDYNKTELKTIGFQSDL